MRVIRGRARFILAPIIAVSALAVIAACRWTMVIGGDHSLSLDVCRAHKEDVERIRIELFSDVHCFDEREDSSPLFSHDHLSLPPQYRGFVLENAVESPLTLKGDNTEVVEYDVSSSQPSEPCFSPKVFGWKRVNTAYLPYEEEAYERKGELAIRKRRARDIRITFLKGDVAAEKMDALTKPLSMTKEIATGALIVNGRYLRRPYVLKADDYRVTVNGVVAASSFVKSPHITGTMSRLAEGLELPIVKVYSGSDTKSLDNLSSQSVKFRDQASIDDYLKTIDRIVKSSESVATKKIRLQSSSLALPLSERNSELILTNWDGID